MSIILNDTEEVDKGSQLVKQAANFHYIPETESEVSFSSDASTTSRQINQGTAIIGRGRGGKIHRGVTNNHGSSRQVQSSHSCQSPGSSMQIISSNNVETYDVGADEALPVSGILIIFITFKQYTVYWQSTWVY